MKTIVTAIVALVMTATAANALTLKKGEVLSSEGGVMAAHETANGKAQLANKGFLISSGNLYLLVEGEVTIVPVKDIAGKSKDDVKEVIVEAVGETMANSVSFDEEAAKQAAYEASVAAEGAIDGLNKTVEELAATVAENNAAAIDTAIAGISEEMADQILEATFEACDTCEMAAGQPGGPIAAN